MMNKEQLIDSIQQCIEVGNQFKQILDQENIFLRRNELDKINEMSSIKEQLLDKYTIMKEKLCQNLEIPKKRFDQIDIAKYIDSIYKDDYELLQLMQEAWDLQHKCHNQFIINHNIIAARMQFLNKKLFDFDKSEEINKLLYTKLDNFIKEEKLTTENMPRIG